MVRVRTKRPRLVLTKTDRIRFEQYHAMLDKLEPAVIRAFIQALDRLEIPAARVQLLFERGQLRSILDLIGFDAFEREFARLMTPELEKIVVEGQKWAASRLPGVATLVPAGFAIMSPDVFHMLQQHSANLIRHISDEQRVAVRRFLTGAFRNGQSGHFVASALKDIVGLSEQQAIFVNNFSAAVDEVVAGELSEAALRSRYRLAPRVRGNIDRVKRLYIERQLLHRGRTIARHETITAFSRGRHAAWARMQEAGAFKGREVMQWLTTPDERACPVCVPLHGVQAPLNGVFTGGGVSVQYPPAHIACRCDTVIILDPDNPPAPSPGRQAADEFLEDRLDLFNQ